MNLEALFSDLKRFLVGYLDPWDLLSLSLVSKAWYKIIHNYDFAVKKMCYPFVSTEKKKYKLTLEQYDCVRRLMEEKFPFKVITGSVGSGKTWTAIGYVFHKYRELLLPSITPPNFCILIILSPTSVEQWCNFFSEKIETTPISTYSGSKFFQHGWRYTIDKYTIVITSETLAATVFPFLIRDDRSIVVIQDEIHHGCSVDRKNVLEIVGLTASIDIFLKKNIARKQGTERWEFVELKNTTLAQSVPEMEFECYNSTGYDVSIKSTMLAYITRRNNHLSVSTLQTMMTLLTFGWDRIPSIPIVVKKGNKWLRYNPKTPTNNDVSFEDNNKNVLNKMNQSPKLKQIADIALSIKKRGEKLLLFDIDQTHILHLQLYLSQFNLNVCPFCTHYGVKGRATMLQQFKKTGDVLIGSIDMLGEAHDLTEASNIMFVRYPNEKYQLEQAMGRCHRPGQVLKTKLHVVISCQLEERLFLTLFEKGYGALKTSELQEFLLEFNENAE